MQPRLVLPVIHHLNEATTLEQAELAFCCGAQGVFLISHRNADSELEAPAVALRARHPDRFIGVNFLSMPAVLAVRLARKLGLQMVWADQVGVHSDGVTDEGRALGELLAAAPHFGMPALFGSVAFKYQAPDANPGLAAFLASVLGMIPTTSGPGTGEAPSVEKIRTMREALGKEQFLAVASGMTPENVGEFLPYVTHFLVATGVSRDAHHFDEVRLREFVRVVASYHEGDGRA